MKKSSKICFKLVLLISLLLSSFLSFSQIKTEVKATGKHWQFAEKVKKGKRETLKRKAQADRLKAQVVARREYKKQYDSLKSIHLDTVMLDSLHLPIFTEEDSLALANEILSQTGMEEYKTLLTETVAIKPKSENADSVALVKAQAVLEQYAKTFLPEELNQKNNGLEGLFKDPLDGNVPDLKDGIPAVRKPTKLNPNLISPTKAQELFQQIDHQQFQEVQKHIAGLKKKYEQIYDSRFPKEGKKRNALKDTPKKIRLHVSGNVAAPSTDPFILNASVRLGYWINAKWLSGVGLSIREQFSARDSLQITTGDAHGYHVFLQYDIKKGVFTRVEWESQVSKSLAHQEQINESSWQNALLVGIGRNFRLGSLQMNSAIYYDMNFKGNTLNAGPLVVKMGVQLTKKPK